MNNFLWSKGQIPIEIRIEILLTYGERRLALRSEFMTLSQVEAVVRCCIQNQLNKFNHRAFEVSRYDKLNR